MKHYIRQILIISFLPLVFPSTIAMVEHNPAEKVPEIATWMHDVNYHFTDSVMVHIQDLSGKLVPARSGSIPVFDDKKSFTIVIDYAEISITPENLTHLMNEYVFAEPASPLRKIDVAIEGDQLKLNGILQRGLALPFEVLGTVTSTPNGLIRIHPIKIKAAHVSAKGFMDLFGIKIANLINVRHTRGIEVQGNDLILHPDGLFPPPRIKGAVRDIQVRGGQIFQTFGSPPRRSRPEPSTIARNYMAYRGGTLQFGKLTMRDTDLILIDADAQDSFDFYLDHYRDQLVAGYSKTTPSFGLHVYMPDYSKIRDEQGLRARDHPDLLPRSRSER